jgi:hypothetical protein
VSEASTSFDLDQVRREIDEEVRARRASGDFPPGMERELDLAFARVSPVATTGDDLEGLLQAADRSAFIEARPPMASRTAVLGLVKRSEQKLLGWYFNHLAQQVTSFAGATVRTLTVLADRLERVERYLPHVEPSLLDHDAGWGVDADVAQRAAARFRDVTGRVLVAGRDENLVPALVAAGIDAYGVAPAAVRQVGPTVDQRDGDPLEHLADLAPGSLGGAILLGLDALATGAKLAHVEAAAVAVDDGGRLLVVAGRPEHWGLDNPVEADLAPGRPFRLETWSVVLEGHGFAAVEVDDAGGSFLVSALRRR